MKIHGNDPDTIISDARELIRRIGSSGIDHATPQTVEDLCLLVIALAEAVKVLRDELQG